MFDAAAALERAGAGAAAGRQPSKDGEAEYTCSKLGRPLVITAVTGLNGAGKTAYAVGLLRQAQRRGIRTVANIGVQGSELVRTFDELMALRDCVLLIDEVTAVANSRQFQSLTPEALLFFQTLRHSNVGCVYTCPTIERADLALRSLTLKWISLTPLVKTVPRGGIWANTHVSFVRSGRPIEGADGTGAKMLSPWFSLYRPARHHADYDSYADVDLFTRSQRFPPRCPHCGLGANYGTKPVSLAPMHNPDEFEASYYCSGCGYLLGMVSKPRSEVITNPELAAHFSAMLTAELHDAPELVLGAVNPPPPSFWIAGPEDLPAPALDHARG